MVEGPVGKARQTSEQGYTRLKARRLILTLREHGLSAKDIGARLDGVYVSEQGSRTIHAGAGLKLSLEQTSTEII